MPDPALYLQAIIAAALASTVCVLVLGRIFSAKARPSVANGVCVAAMGLGLLLGYRVLQTRVVWPPTKGFDRLLVIILPAAIAIELFAGLRGVPRLLVWLARFCLAGASARILLHNSVYLSGPERGWTETYTWGVLLFCAALLSAAWYLLVSLKDRGAGVSLPLAVAASIQCAGLTVMLSGYVSGGAGAIPLVSTVVAVVVASGLLKWSAALEGVLGIAVVGLFGLLLIGCFFGGLSTDRALIICSAPLLCWVTEAPFFRGRPPWQLGVIRLVIVMIPLSAVLLSAKRDFDQKTRPLLGTVVHAARVHS